MELNRVNVFSLLNVNQRSCKAFITPGGVQIMSAINLMGSGEEKHVSIGTDNDYATEEMIDEVVSLFFDCPMTNLKIYTKLSYKPPPTHMVHMFGPVPLRERVPRSKLIHTER